VLSVRRFLGLRLHTADNQDRLKAAPLSEVEGPTSMSEATCLNPNGYTSAPMTYRWSIQSRPDTSGRKDVVLAASNLGAAIVRSLRTNRSCIGRLDHLRKSAPRDRVCDILFL